MSKRKLSFAVVLLLFLATIGLTGCSSASTGLASAQTPSATQTPVATSSPALSSSGLLAAYEGTLEDIYAKVNPSVVNIRVVQKQEMPAIPFFDFPAMQGPKEFYKRGLGSGFVWDKEGRIVTNNHVVAGADRISVTFYDGATAAGKVVSTDPDSDLAVVKVDVSADRLQPVKRADSAQVKVGQLAIAIGNPFGLQGTMTTGVVSALGRSLPVPSEVTPGSAYSIPDIIQTDAPVNPGNSGGVLLDAEGRLIGVPAAILSPAGSSAGIGFAIPTAIVEKVVDALITSGHYEHPWLGVSVTSLSPDVAKAMDLQPDQRGALIVDVLPDSPADKAALHGSDRQVTIEGQQLRVGGDVILAVDGQIVKEASDLITYLTRHTEVGQTIALTVLRDKRERQIDVTLAARPTSQQQENQTSSGQVGSAWLGISGLTVTPEIAQAMNLQADQQGVLVEQVVANSPADQAGLQGSYKPLTANGETVLVGGDIITAFNGEPVTRFEKLQALLQDAQPGQEVKLSVLRGGVSMQIAVTLGKRSLSSP